jgi:hypothetical protein
MATKRADGKCGHDIHTMRSFYIFFFRVETTHKPTVSEVTDDSELRFDLEADESKIVRRK